MGYSTPLFLAALVASAYAVPTGLRHTCAQTCADATKFAFERGMSYEYDYKVQTTTTNSPKDFEKQAAMTVTSKATIGVLAPCEYILTLSDVALEGSSLSSEFGSALIKKPLRFAFDDGRITEVCSDSEEEAWVINFKRGVLSAFQNTMSNFQEEQSMVDVDVTGECETLYKVSPLSESDTFIIERTKSSESCKRMPTSAITNLPTPLQRLPLISADQKCMQKVVAGIVTHVKCDETLLMRPVSGTEGGATTAVSTELTLVASTAGVQSADLDLVATSMEFDGRFDSEKTEGYFRIIEALLQELDSKSTPMVQSQVPALFTQLVENLRQLNHRQFSQLYDANRGTRVWNFLVDAAPLVATPASTTIVTKLITSGQMTQEEANVWFTSLAFVTSPKAEMFPPLTELLLQQSSTKALLGISGLINAYCKIDPSCTEQTAVREVLSAIEVGLGNACRSSSFEEKERILVTLKALGNAGRWMNVEVMNQCFSEIQNPFEIRVMALESWRRAPCNYDRSGLLNVYTNSREDSEVRIAAYLSLMACPNQEIINIIKDRLVSESVNQVGSFVWTHLSNLQESASQGKQWIRSMIGEDMLVNKFNTSSLKFSRNFESSFYMNELGLGSTVESNVIFSSKSFLPRSAMFNLTLDLFGESVNMFEVGGRLEGFEVFAEKFFGPQGYYPEETVSGILKSLRQSQAGDETTIEHLLEVITEEPEGSYYLKVLGNELQYHHFRGIENFFEKKPEFNYLEMLMELAKKGNVDYTKSYKLIDTELSYPTASGLPLTLKLNSTATLGLRMDGKFAMRSFRDVDIEGHVYPSAVVQVDATMLMDANVARTGIKVSSNVHTSSFVDGKLIIEGGKVIDIAFNLPQDKIELINVQSETVFIENDGKKIQDDGNENGNFGECIDTDVILGVKWCAGVSTSPFKSRAAVWVEKTNSFTGYSLRVLKESDSISFLVDTPGSRRDRKLSFVAIKDDQEVKIDIHTPWKSVKAAGTYIVSQNGRRYELEAIADSTRKYQVSVGHSLEREGTTLQFKPFLLIKSPSSIFVDTEGSFESDSKLGLVKVDLENRGLMPASIKLSTSCGEDMKKFESEITSSVLTVSASGNIQNNDRLASKLEIDYAFMGQPEQHFSHNFKYEKLVNEQEKSYSGAFLFQASEFPGLTVNTKGKMRLTQGRVEASGSVNIGGNLFDLSTDNTLTYGSNVDATFYDARLTLVSSSHSVDALLTEKFKLQRNYLIREAYLRLTPSYELKSKTEMAYNKDIDGYARVHFSFLDFDGTQEISFTKIAEKYYTAQLLGRLNGDEWNFAGSYQDRSISGESVDLVLGVKSKVNYVEGEASIGIKADRQRGASVEAKANYSGIEKFAKVIATTTSLELDTNIFMDITLQAKVQPDGPIKSVEVKGVWDKLANPTDIVISGRLEERSITGLFKLGDIEKRFRGDIESTGVKVEVHLGPSQTILGKASYDISEGLTLAATVETPFSSYEKQDAMISFKKLANKEFSSQISVVWRNAPLVALSASGKVESNYLLSDMAANLSVTCDETIFGVERIVFNLNHQRNRMDIDSSISGTVDGNEVVKGFLKKSFSTERRDIEASLVTPISEDFSFKSEHELFRTGKMELKYGSDNLVSAYSKNDLQDKSGMQLEYTLTSTVLDNIRALATYRNVNNQKTIEIEANYADKKYIASFNLEKQVSGVEINFIGSGRIIMPHLAPITGSLTTSIKDEKQITSDFEITRFWSSYGNLKVHSNINFQSATNLQFLATLTSPDNRASIDTMFNYESNKVDAFAKGVFNGAQKSITLRGFADLRQHRAKLVAAAKDNESTVFKITFAHEHQDNTKTTQLNIKRRNVNYDITHHFTFSGNFNWNNKLQVNDMYLNNDMKYENGLYSHRFDWNFGGPFISGEGSFSVDRNDKSLRLNGEISATSSWTSDIKMEIKYESDGSIYKPEVVIEYGPSSKISVSTICSCLPEKCSIKVNLETSFWEAIVFEGAIEMFSPRSLKMFYSKGSHTAAIDLAGVWSTDKKTANIEIASSLYLPYPIKIEAGLEKNGEESTISFALNAGKIYRGKLTYTGLSKQGKLSGEIQLPCFHWGEFKFSLDYDCSRLPSHVNLLLSNNDRPLKISAILSEQAAVIEVVNEYNNLKIESSWSYSSTNGLVQFNVSSPKSKSVIINAQLEYNWPNKFVDFFVKNDSELLCKLHISKLRENAGVLDAQFSLDKLLLSYDESNFKGLLVLGQRAVELVGTYTRQTESGEYTMEINTPFPGLESISSSMTYNFGTDKKIDFKFAVGADEISLVAVANVSDWHAPKISIDVTTTLDQYRSIGGEVMYNVVSATKFCEIVLHRNNEVLSWKLEILQENSRAGKALVRVTSPFVNYELFELGLEYSLSDGSYQGKVHQVLNAVHSEYLLKLTLSSNSLSGEIIPSNEEERKLSFTGEFENGSMKSTATLMLNIDDDVTRIVGELIKDLTSPQVNILITSPFETYKNVEFHGNYKIGRGEQTFESTLKTPMDLYSIGFQARQQYKQGEFGITFVTPLPGYSSIGFKGRYNFIDNTKAANAEFEINGQREVFSFDLQLNDNNVIIAIESPFPDFRQVRFTGDMTHINGKRTILADIQNGSNRYSVSGEVNISENYFLLRTDAAQSQYGSLEISGQKTQSGYILHYNKDGKEKKMIVDYNMEPTAASIRIQTPFAGFKDVALTYNYQKTQESLSTSFNFEKDEIKFHCSGDARYSELGSSIVLDAEIPSLDQKIVLKANYDISQNTKQAELSARYNSAEEKLQVTIRHDSNTAALRVTVPFINEEYGAEYKFLISQDKKSIVGSFIGLFNSETYEFTAHAELNSDNLEMTFTTPYNEFERIHASAGIDYSQKTSTVRVTFGPYESTFELCYDLAQPILEIVTPFEIIHHLKLSYNVELASDEKKMDVFAAYNQYKYGISLFYQPTRVEERVMVIVTHEKSSYKFTAGWTLEDRNALLICRLESPLKGLNDIRFTTKVDLTKDDKAIEIILQNEDDTKMIALNGKFIGDLVDFRIQTPFTGLRDFRSYGSLNRTKRSLEFDIMNDGSSGSVSASFNSLSVVVKSPYPAAREATLKIEKTDGQGFLLEYKRGDNFFNLNLSPGGRSQTFEVRVNSAIPGWEVLALLGRIDRDDLIAYVSGQINEAKMTIQGGGTFGRREADLKYDITTPYADYQSVTATLAYNLRRKDFNFEVKSASSDFRIIVKSKPSFTVDVFVPNSQEPTIITANITIFKGNFSIQSRFPRLRTFKLDYNVSLGKNEVDITTKIESNSVEIFNLEFKRGGGKAHLKIEARRGDNHSMIHFHRVGFETAEFVFHRNQKEFKVEAQGTGNLPTKGSIDAVINNSFREVPRTVSAHIDVDRSGSPKTIKLELTFPGSKLYIFDLKYNGDLSRPQIADYNLSITTPQRRAYEWQNISGKWNFSDHDNALIEFKYGNTKYVARGKFGLTQSNIVITSSNPNIEDIILEYRFSKTSTSSERTRDYYLKVGTVSKYLLYTLKGTFSGIEHGDAEHSFQLSRFMKAPVNTKFNWHRDSSGLSGQGSFDYGDYNGTYTLKKVKREASTRSLVLSFEASTNIPNFSKITVDGEYNFDNQAIFKLDIIWDTSKISINFNINDITSDVTEQTASFSLPNIGDVNVTFGHDFRNKKKTFTVIGQLSGRVSHLKAEWTRNKDFTKLSGKIDIDSILLGKANVDLQWDVRDINNAKAELKYTRNEDKNVHIKWVRKFTGAELDAEILFESHFQRLPTAKISINANFSQGFALNVSMAGANKEIKLILNVGDNSVTGEFVSPIPGFEQINGSLTYNMTNPNNKIATLRYTRGDKKVNMDMNIEITSNQAGKLTVSLETPFEFVRTLSLDASWNNNRGEVHYKRNDISYDFTGQAQVKSDSTSFEVNFTPTSNEPVKIAFSFNKGSLISGDGTEPQEIADIELQMLGKRIAFELKGFRNSERIMIELEAESSLEQLRELEVKLDSEFNTQERNGLFEIKVDDFHFKIRNYFKRKDDGYYLRSEIDSTLTSLPGLIIGIGREGASRIVTVGYGEDREITVSLVGKEDYRKGFSGKVSLPRRGIVDAALDVNYSFSGNDVLNVDIKFELEPGKVIQADVVYNSDGVRARLSSPRSGRHSARARRSVTENSFMVDIGVDDYSFSLRGDLLNSDIKRGFVIEGEVFGRKISVETLYQSDGSQHKEGKFIIKTTVVGYENLGGWFSFSNRDKQIHGRCEINLPSYFYPKISANIDFNLDEKIKGLGSLDISGQVFTVHIDLVGSLLDGYDGNIMIRTPYHLASQITMDGHIKVESMKKISASLAVAYPLGSKNIQLKYNIIDKVFAEARIENLDSGKILYIKIDHANKGNAVKSSLTINRSEISLEFRHQLPNLSGELHITSDHFDLPVSISFSKEEASMMLTGTFAGQTHVMSGKYQKNGRDIDFSALINSPLIGNRQMIAFKHVMPLSYLSDNFAVQITYTGEATYDIIAKLDRDAGIKATITIDSPAGASLFEVYLQDAANKTDVRAMVLLPDSEHKAIISVSHFIVQEQAGKLVVPQGTLEFDLELTSTLLVNDIIYSLKVDVSDEKKMTEQMYMFGGFKQTLKAGYSYTAGGVHLVFDIDTPLFDIGKAALSGELNFSNAIKAKIEATFRNETHAFDINMDTDERELLIVMKSPMIPGEIAKIEASGKGNYSNNLQLALAFRLDRKTFASKLQVNAPSSNNMLSALEVKTPFRGYRKMNFRASFENNEKIKVSFFADRPFGYQFEMVSGDSTEGHNSRLDIKTAIEGFETVSVLVKIPYAKTAPKFLIKLPSKEYGLDFDVETMEFSRTMSSNLNLNGMAYGAGFGLRTKSPYEFSYHYHVQKMFKRFHIMMDSSFFSLFSLFL